MNQLPRLFIDNPNAAPRARTEAEEEEDLPPFLRLVAGAPELVANILQTLADPGDPEVACNTARDWVRTSLVAYAPAQHNAFWGQLTEAVFGKYLGSFDVIMEWQLPSGRSQFNRTKLPFQDMFYSVCRLASTYEWGNKPFGIVYEQPWVFRVGFYVLALLGNRNALDDPDATDAGDLWAKTLLDRMRRLERDPAGPCLLLQDPEFAIAFMRRAFRLVNTRRLGRRGSRTDNWMIDTAREYFPGPFDDIANPLFNPLFRLLLYRITIVKDWSEVCDEPWLSPSAHERLTEWGKILMGDASFVLNMLEENNFEVLAYLPPDSELWTNRHLLQELDDIIYNSRDRLNWPLTQLAEDGFLKLARRVHAMSNVIGRPIKPWLWWVKLMSMLTTFESEFVPSELKSSFLADTDFMSDAWAVYISLYLANAQSIENFVSSDFLKDVVRYLHGEIASSDQHRRLPVTASYDFWRSVFSLFEGAFAADTMRSLRELVNSVGHDQQFLVYIVRIVPSLMDLATAPEIVEDDDEPRTPSGGIKDAAYFRFEESDALRALFGDADFLKRWAVVSKAGMPNYIIDYPDVAHAFVEKFVALTANNNIEHELHENVLGKVLNPNVADFDDLQAGRWEDMMNEEAPKWRVVRGSASSWPAGESSEED